MSSLPRAEGNTDRTQADARVAYRRQTRTVVINIADKHHPSARGESSDCGRDSRETCARYISDLRHETNHDHRTIINRHDIESY